MSYKLDIVQKQNYLHFTVTGINNRENTASYLEEILRECKARNCSRVLIEERLDGHLLGVADVFEIISEIGPKALGAVKKIAYVDINMDSSSMRFAETVAVNRSLPVLVFPTVAEAEKSMLSDGPAVSETK